MICILFYYFIGFGLYVDDVGSVTTLSVNHSSDSGTLSSRTRGDFTFNGALASTEGPKGSQGHLEPSQGSPGGLN